MLCSSLSGLLHIFRHTVEKFYFSITVHIHYYFLLVSGVFSCIPSHFLFPLSGRLSPQRILLLVSSTPSSQCSHVFYLRHLLNSHLKIELPSLITMAQFGHRHAKQKVAGSIPCQSTCLGCWFCPQSLVRTHMRGN